MDDFAEEEVVENPTLRAAYNLAPLHQNQPLRWDYKVHLIGEKINDKMIHLCEVCELPILVYGRIMPCKHVFCFDCACKCDKVCKRCGIKIRKVEKSALGTVFVCTHGAPKHSKEGCRRSYLSQRDLKAHHVHRHVPKSSTDGAMSPSASTPAQPVPNQLPLTKQQAAQQASQKQVVTPSMSHSSPGQSHIQSSVLPVQNSMVPPASGLYLQQSSSLPVGSQHMSPVPPLIPGLGDLRAIVTMAQPIIGQNSPLVQTSSGSSTLSQGMNLPYSSAAQANTDVFRPVEMVQQQAMGAPGSHLQSNQSLPAYQQTAQFPVSTPIMQQISSQQLSSTAAGQLHPSSFIHTLPPLPVPQSLDCYGEPQSMNSSAQMSQQPRTNLNLITVPIQDEGQYRPLPNVTSPLNPHFGTSYPQTRPSVPSQTQSYTQPPLTPGTFSTPATFPQMAAQPQNMTAPNSPQSLQFNQPGALHPNSPGLMINPRQGLGGSVHPGVPRALADVMNVLAIRAQGAGMIPTQVGGMPAQVGGMPTQVGGMPTQVGGMPAQSAGVLSTQGGGLMPTPGTGGQGMVNRFPPGGRWTAPRIIQPRMTQGQQRPHNDGQFNQSGYYH